jgi:hypothetical protein
VLARAEVGNLAEGPILLSYRRQGPLAVPARLGPLFADSLLYGEAYSLFEFVPNFPTRSLYLPGGDVLPGEEWPIHGTRPVKRLAARRKLDTQKPLYGSSPRCAAQTAIWALELDPNLLRMLRTWLWTVRSERWSSKEIWRLVSPCPTKTATSRSRPVRGSSGASTREGLRGVSRGRGGLPSAQSVLYGSIGRHRSILRPSPFPRTLIAKHAACGAHPAFVVVPVEVPMRKGDPDLLA